MGGRGGSSGTSGARKIPAQSEFELIQSLPQLKGSEKQVAWAKKIRREVGPELISYAINFTSDGRRSGLYDIATQGRSAIKKDIYESLLVKSATGKVKQEKIQNSFKGYQDLARRIQTVNSILQNDSAKFWIDNRTNTLANYMNKKLKKKIDGK